MQYYILSQTNFNPPSQPSPMEVSSIRGLSELGIEDPTTTSFSQWHMNPADDFSILPFPLAAALGGDSFSNSNFDLKNQLEASQTANPKPAKQMKTNAWNPQATFSSATLSFVNSDHTNPVAIVKPKKEAAWPKATAEAFPCDSFISQNSFENQNYVLKACQGAKRGCPTGARLAHTQDHIIAERKRRERLSQRFIALSAIVPGLKKMDKASVLGDAIKYLKQLQERVRILEEQTNKKTTESVVFVKKSQLFAEGDESCSDGALPEIEARFSERSVLIRIHCEKRKGVLERTVEEIEKWHLSVTNSSVITFGSSALDITILAQMDMEFLMTAEDLVKNLRSAFQLFM